MRASGSLQTVDQQLGNLHVTEKDPLKVGNSVA